MREQTGSTRNTDVSLAELSMGDINNFLAGCNTFEDQMGCLTQLSSTPSTSSTLVNIASVFENLGQEYADASEFSKAERCFKGVLNIKKRVADPQQQALTLRSLAFVYAGLRKPTHQQECIRRAEILGQSQQSVDYFDHDSEAKNHEGSETKEPGPQRTSIVQEAKEITRLKEALFVSEEPYEKAKILVRLADAYEVRGDERKQQAECLEKASNILPNVEGLPLFIDVLKKLNKLCDDPSLAATQRFSILTKLGKCYLEFERAEEVLPGFLTKLENAFEGLQLSIPNQASIQMLLGKIYLKLKKPEEANQAFNEIPTLLLEGSYSPQHPLIREALEKLEDVYTLLLGTDEEREKLDEKTRKAKEDRTLEILRQTLKMREKNYGKEHALVASALIDLGTFHAGVNKDFKKQLKLLTRAWAIQNKVGIRGYEDEAKNILTDMAKALRNLGGEENTAKAQAYLYQVQEIEKLNPDVDEADPGFLGSQNASGDEGDDIPHIPSLLRSNAFTMAGVDRIPLRVGRGGSTVISGLPRAGNLENKRAASEGSQGEPNFEELDMVLGWQTFEEQYEALNQMVSEPLLRPSPSTVSYVANRLMGLAEQFKRSQKFKEAKNCLEAAFRVQRRFGVAPKIRDIDVLEDFVLVNSKEDKEPAQDVEPLHKNEIPAYLDSCETLDEKYECLVKRLLPRAGKDEFVLMELMGALTWFGVSYMKLEQYSDARDCLIETRKIERRFADLKSSVDIRAMEAKTLGSLAETYRVLGQKREQIECLKEELDLLVQIVEQPDNRDLSRVLRKLGSFLDDVTLSNVERAEILLALGKCYFKFGRVSRAKDMLETALALIQSEISADHSVESEILENLEKVRSSQKGAVSQDEARMSVRETKNPAEGLEEKGGTSPEQRKMTLDETRKEIETGMAAENTLFEQYNYLCAQLNAHEDEPCYLIVLSDIFLKLSAAYNEGSLHNAEEAILCLKASLSIEKRLCDLLQQVRPLSDAQRVEGQKRILRQIVVLIGLAGLHERDEHGRLAYHRLGYKAYLEEAWNLFLGNPQLMELNQDLVKKQLYGLCPMLVKAYLARNESEKVLEMADELEGLDLQLATQCQQAVREHLAKRVPIVPGSLYGPQTFVSNMSREEPHSLLNADSLGSDEKSDDDSELDFAIAQSLELNQAEEGSPRPH